MINDLMITLFSVEFRFNSKRRIKLMIDKHLS